MLLFPLDQGFLGSLENTSALQVDVNGTASASCCGQALSHVMQNPSNMDMYSE